MLTYLDEISGYGIEILSLLLNFKIKAFLNFISQKKSLQKFNCH